jgi:hypothetical protein
MVSQELRVDHEFYYKTIDKMEKMSVDPEYVQGWIGGYMGNPKREEQRVTEAYEAGYEHGEKGDTADFESWVKG